MTVKAILEQAKKDLKDKKKIFDKEMRSLCEKTKKVNYDAIVNRLQQKPLNEHEERFAQFLVRKSREYFDELEGKGKKKPNLGTKKRMTV